MVAELINPPLARDYKRIVGQSCTKTTFQICNKVKVCDQSMPIIDMIDLNSEDECERAKCMAKIVQSSSEWGFFQVVNHGISPELLNAMRREQIKLFDSPFENKSTCGLLNNSYRWGAPNATSPNNFSWSEAFHVPLTKISDQACYGHFYSLREVLVEYAASMERLARVLTEVLVTSLGETMEVFEEMISDETCFLRLNRYPPCPLSSEVHGLVPHTDSDFLTILHQDQVGGLELMKDSKWYAVKPHNDALIVNIGDLFQAWSNDLYKSVEHKVMTNTQVERYSIAYFLCPSYDSTISSYKQPSLHRSFTFGDYRKQIQQDAKLLGRKIGLSRFLH